MRLGLKADGLSLMRDDISWHEFHGDGVEQLAELFEDLVVRDRLPYHGSPCESPTSNWSGRGRSQTSFMLH